MKRGLLIWVIIAIPGIVIVAAALMGLWGIIFMLMNGLPHDTAVLATGDGCYYNNPPCQSNFFCVKNICHLRLMIDPKDVCSVVDGQMVCTMSNVIVEGPLDQEETLAHHAQILQYQYNFLATYLEFQPTKKLVRVYPENISKYCPPRTSGCSRDEMSYWRKDALDLNWYPSDHEFNHAFSMNIPLVHDFNEAQARYLSLKEKAYAHGYSILDYMKIVGPIDGHFYTRDEENWKFMINGSSEDACRNVASKSSNGSEDFKLQCQYMFILIKYDSKDLLKSLLKNAFEGKIDISSRERLDKEINLIVSNN